jgi:putative DNA methylase
MNSEAVNTCLVFVARKQDGTKPAATLRDLLARLRKICSGAFRLGLQTAGWSEDDIGIALFAEGAAMLANVLSLSSGETAQEALLAFERVVREEFPDFSVQKRTSL